MDWWQNGVDYGNRVSNTSSESNFWPVEHPIEPRDEDQPIKCPTPHPSLLNEERFLHYPRNKSVTSSLVLNKEETGSTSEPRGRPMRKRHHKSSRPKDNNSTHSTEPPRHSFSAHDNLKIFPMFQKFYKFES